MNTLFFSSIVKTAVGYEILFQDLEQIFLRTSFNCYFQGENNKHFRSAINRFKDLENLGILVCNRVGCSFIKEEGFSNCWIEVCHNKVQNYIRLDGRPSYFSDISLLSGLCLFSKHHGIIATQNNLTKICLNDRGSFVTHPIINIETNVHGHTLYEIEALSRLTHVISIISNTTATRRPIHIHIPRLEYYMYLLDAYNKNLISNELILKYFDLVDERHYQNLSLFKKLLSQSHHLQPFPLNPLEQNNNNVEEYIKDTIYRNKPINFTKLLEIITQSSDLLNKVLNLAATTSFFPNDFRSLGDLSYIAAELYEHFYNPDRLMIVIDTPQESKILSQVKKLCQIKAVVPNMIGVYPFSKIGTQLDDEKTNFNLYNSDVAFHHLPEDIYDHLKQHYPLGYESLIPSLIKIDKSH